MSEFMTPDAAERLIRGTEGDQGLLTRRIREQPFCVLLLDEIEKAHPAVFDLLLQVCGLRAKSARVRRANVHLDPPGGRRYRAARGDGDLGRFRMGRGEASSNRKKHGVSFEEAAEAMRDPFSVDFDDVEHPENTVTLAMSPRDRILYVVTTERGDRVRIISARVATSHERHLYEEDA